MRGIEAGLMMQKQERKPIPNSNEQYSIQRAEYFLDRAINHASTDPISIEHEARYLELHTQELLDLITKSQSPENSEMRLEAERVILKLFKNAEYRDENQLNSPPGYRKFSNSYERSIQKIYCFLAQQTLATSGKATEDYDHLTFFPKNTAMGSGVINGLKKKDRGESTKSEVLGSNRLLIRMLEEFQVPPEKILETWNSSGYKHTGDQMTLGAMQNIEAMRYLNQTNPGSVNALYNHYGISHFGRYPEKALDEQVKEIDNISSPYGVMFTAVDDHNGAFRSGLWSETHALWKQLNGKYLYRIFEIDRKFTLGRRLVECNAKYGDQNKITFVKFNGHGETNKIILGKLNEGTWKQVMRLFSRETEPTSISSSDLEGGGFKRAKDFLIDSPHLIFTACNAGEEGGIVQKSSKTYEAEALGQAYEGSNFPIRVALNDQGIISKFVADPSEWEELIGRYKNGKKISENPD